jgi:hypothetical protein
MNDFIDNKIIMPMNNFADRHPNLPMIISILALLASILK